MLQQTRAQAVAPYYVHFLQQFPDAAALARASQSAVLAAWSGLGYYSRARNLQRAAGEVAARGFPRNYETIRELPGVGSYTASAVASIAFGQPHAVVDGNVLRVLSRLTNDSSDLGLAQSRSRFEQMAQVLLDRRQPGSYNQAMMELGATICAPKTPHCPLCPVSEFCEAQAAETQNMLPVKARKAPSQIVECVSVVVVRDGRILLWERPADSPRMAGFWELPAPEQLPGLQLAHTLGSFRHTIANHRYLFTVFSGKISRSPRGMQWFAGDQLSQMPLSTSARKALGLTNGYCK